MEQKQTIWNRIGAFLKASRLRLKAEMPKYFKAINDIANAILGLAVGFQPDLLEFINAWLQTGLHPLPWLQTISQILAGVGLGAKLVAKLTANLAKLSETQIEKINPTQPEIAEQLSQK